MLKTLAQRFKLYVNTMPTPKGCHLWMGSTNRKGYGRFDVEGKQKRATHVAWFLETGEWPTQQLLHTCDTPPCVRFIHLFEGTALDNAHDMIAKGRNIPLLHRYGEDANGAKLTWERVKWVRKMYIKGLFTQSEIAVICKVSRRTIHGIVHNKSYVVECN